MKKCRFLWSAHRITERQKAGKSRSIKGKQLKNSRNTVSRKQEEQASSQSVNLDYRRDKKLEQAFQRNPYSSRVFVVVKSGVRVRIHGGLQHVCNKLSLKLGHFFLVVMY